MLYFLVKLANPDGVTALVVSDLAVVSAVVANSTIPLVDAVADTISGIFLFTIVQSANVLAPATSATIMSPICTASVKKVPAAVTV